MEEGNEVMISNVIELLRNVAWAKDVALLKKASKHRSAFIRQAVAENSWCPSYVLETLVGDEDEAVRLTALQRLGIKSLQL
jgi:hypothetical protein